MLAAVQLTWLKDVKDMDIAIVDSTFMPEGVPDTYPNLPHKTKMLCRHAKERQYNWLIKIDVDSFVRPKLLAAPAFDYAGRYRGASGGFPAPFCSGGAYWLSARAIEMVAQAEINDNAEDRWVGNTLLKFGIAARHLPGYIAPTHAPVSDYLKHPEVVVLMQIEEPLQQHRYYAGQFDMPVRPAGADRSHYPCGSQLRAQMRKP